MVWWLDLCDFMVLVMVIVLFISRSFLVMVVLLVLGWEMIVKVWCFVILVV